MAGITQQDVAGVYADALLAVARQQGAVESLLEEWTALADLMRGNRRLGEFLKSPLVDASERAAAIEKVFRGKASDLLVDALQVINRKGRSAYLLDVAEAYRKAVDRAAGRVDVKVSTAVPLSAALREELAAAILKFSGRQAILHETVDESLLAGMVVRVGDQRFDTSASSALKRLDTALLERASRQIMQGQSVVEG